MARVQDHEPRVVRAHDVVGEHPLPDPPRHGSELVADRGHGIAEGRARQLHARTLVDLPLPVERDVLQVLADEDLGQEPRCELAPLHHARRGRGADHGVAAAAAGPLLAADRAHVEAGRLVLEQLALVVATDRHALAAAGAGLRALRHRDEDGLAGEIRRPGGRRGLTPAPLALLAALLPGLRLVELGRGARERRRLLLGDLLLQQAEEQLELGIGELLAAASVALAHRLLELEQRLGMALGHRVDQGDDPLH